jgi:hypothetical protein
VTKYYFFNGKAVAMRSNAGILWLHGDMLGSASLMTDGGGTIVGQARYKPYGEKRNEWNIYFTNRKFTGMPEEFNTGGLVMMGARCSLA